METTAELNQIFQTAVEGMRVIDKNFNTIRVNNAFLYLSGVNSDQAIGKKCYEVFHGSLCHTPGCPLTRVLNGDRHIECNVEKEHKEGTRISCILRVVPFCAPDGEFIGIIESFKDITQCKLAQEELGLKNTLLLTKQESLLDGVLVVDEKMNMISFSQRFVDMWGIPSDIMASKLGERAIQWVLTKVTNPEEFAKWVLCMDEHHSEKSKEKIVLLDGRIFDRYSVPMFCPGGKYCGRVWYFRDVTEHKKMQEDLLKVEKLESVGILASGIAHDFNNILSAILGCISLAKVEANRGSEIFRNLDEAEKAALRAKDLTGHLLSFTKDTAPTRKVVFPAESLKDAANFALRGSNVKCKFAIADDLRKVEIDEGEISQVINNLIINADQAMPEGGKIKVMAGNVTVGAKDKLPLKSGKYVKVSIKDSGVGIPPEHLSRIFDPYFTTKQKGSGLGLATAYFIIRRHGGYITVRSEMGAGTTFHIYFPACGAGVSLEKSVEKRPLIVGKGRILVMDDEKLVRKVIGRMLKRLGYEAEFTKDGAETIELYKRANEYGKPFDVVIMDLTIPGAMGGREAIKNLLETDPEAKVIVSSGYFDDPVMVDFRKQGFSNIIAKPYEIRELSQTLHDVLHGDG